MLDALYVGATGMRGQQLQIDTIAHNLANVNTAGFRRGVVSFSEVSAALSLDGPDSVHGMRAPGAMGAMLRGAGVSGDIALSLLAGELKATGEPLDLAVDGPGFMEVIRSDGTPAYTRAGNLTINPDGLLAVSDGSPLAARVEIPSDAREVHIGPDGRVSVRVADREDPVEVGQLDLVTFANPSALRAAGSNLYVADAAAGEPRVGSPGELGMGFMRQGFIEASNVQLTDELVTMMVAQRAFELNARVVQAADQMLSITNSLYR